MGVSHMVVQRSFRIGGVYMTNVSPRVYCRLRFKLNTNVYWNKIAGINWRELHDMCINDGILPPTTGSLTFNASGPPRTTSRSRKRKNQS